MVNPLGPPHEIICSWENGVDLARKKWRDVSIMAISRSKKMELPSTSIHRTRLGYFNLIFSGFCGNGRMFLLMSCVLIWNLQPQKKRVVLKLSVLLATVCEMISYHYWLYLNIIKSDSLIGIKNRRPLTESRANNWNGYEIVFSSGPCHCVVGARISGSIVQHSFA